MRKAWNKGLTKQTDKRVKKYSNSGREKKRLSHLGLKHSEETKQKISKAHKGKIFTKEQRNKISATLKRRFKSGEIISSWKGKHHTDESKKKIVKNRRSYFKSGNPMFGKKRSSPQGEKSLSYKTGIGIYRKVALRNKEMKCVDCGLEDGRVLLVHHIDKNRLNNKLENLQILCRNCHAIKHNLVFNFKKKILTLK